MAGLSTYLANLFLNHFRGTNIGTAPAAVYVGLHTADPTDAGTTGEVTTTIRVAGRVAVTFAAPSSKVITSNADADFGNAAGGSGTITHFSIWDAASGGNCLGTAAVTASKAWVTGQGVKFPSGSLTVNLA